MDKPRQSFFGLWNISFGYLGIQIAFGLQSANVSRIFQLLGSPIENLAFLWMAGPVTGLLVQPLIGYYSDRTWGRFGRRRPFFFGGAVLAGLALLLMPNAGGLIIAALLLWLLDASLNVSMEPFRAFVGDMVSSQQRAQGFAFQTMFIGVGAVIGSIAPWVLTRLGVANTAPVGIIPPAVRYSFYIGAAAIVSAVLYTVLRVREFSPDEMAGFASSADAVPDSNALIVPKGGLWWFAVGAVLVGAVWWLALDKQLYLFGGGLALFGLLQLFNQVRPGTGALAHILSDLMQMPEAMRRLALAQFFTWVALFIMWIYTTPIVTQYVFHTADTASKAYNDGGDWVGILFAVYNGVAALAAFILPLATRRIGSARTHMACLGVGAASFASLLVIRYAQLLIVPFIGVGVAWASILTMPYVLLTQMLPPAKLGIYVGIFNFFVVLPQLVVAAVMGAVMKAFFPHQPIWTMAFAAGTLVLAAAAMLRVRTGD